MYALIVRNPDCISRSQTYSELSSLSAQQLRDLGVVAGLAAETDRDFLSDYGTTIAVNLTEVPLVLPTCGIYIQNFYTFDHIILPVSPQKAIVFIEERGKNTIIHDGIVQLYAINNEHTIQSFNKNAFSTQCRYKNGFIISSEKTALMDCLE